jgi:hypothetical protein
MVDTDNVREFKKLSKDMGDKLDQENGRYIYSCLPLLPPSTLILSFSTIESLEAPDFNQNASIDLIVNVP